MDSGKTSHIARLVDRFMALVTEVADEGDWAESDGWVGKMVLITAKGEHQYIYRIQDGKMTPTDSPGPYVAVMTMSTETFLDLIESAFEGRAEVVFQEKYARRHIQYEGDRWIVDSERFREVFKRIGKIPAHRLVG